jgi:5-carboxymethyl-2-hydroxymuconate isomerase
MPHFNIEYSSNLEDKADMSAFCSAMRGEILATGLFEVGAVRVRAAKFDHYAIADELAENAFVDMSFRIGVGRSAQDKARIGEALFARASDFFKPLFQTPHFAMTLEIREIDPNLSWRKNAIHPRLRAKG